MAETKEMSRNELVDELSQSIPHELVEDLISSYEKTLIEYRKGRWEETLWKAGKFAENIFRILDFLLAGKVKKEVPHFKEVIEVCKIKKVSKA